MVSVMVFRYIYVLIFRIEKKLVFTVYTVVNLSYLCEKGENGTLIYCM